MFSDAWAEIPDDHYRRLFDEFAERFRFQASTNPQNWPGIAEPPGSVTLDLDEIFQPGRYEPGQQRIDDLVLASFLRLFDSGTSLLVLDWQHPGYQFWPHRLPDTSRWPRWPDSPLGPFPDGDYYIFLTEDMSQGTFGHPWERTLCVWGDDLVRDLVPELPLPVKRRRPVG